MTREGDQQDAVKTSQVRLRGDAPRKEDFNGPVKPISKYTAFCDFYREQVTSELKAECKKKKQPFNSDQVVPRLLEAWRNMDNAKKIGLQKLCDNEKELYRAQVEEWKRTEHYKKYQAEKRAYVRRKKNLKTKMEDKMKEEGQTLNIGKANPSQQVYAAYLVYWSERRPVMKAEWEERSSTPFTSIDLAKAIATEWIAMPKEEKRIYEEVKQPQYYEMWLVQEAEKRRLREKLAVRQRRKPMKVKKESLKKKSQKKPEPKRRPKALAKHFDVKAKKKLAEKLEIEKKRAAEAEDVEKPKENDYGNNTPPKDAPPKVPKFSARMMRSSTVRF